MPIAGCSTQPWSVTAYNSDFDRPVGVRLVLPAERVSWILEPDQIAKLVERSGWPKATLELFDPETCATLATKVLPEGPSVLVIVDQGVTGDGDWQIEANPEDPTDAVPEDPNFDGCK